MDSLCKLSTSCDVGLCFFGEIYWGLERFGLFSQQFYVSALEVKELFMTLVHIRKYKPFFK